MKKPRRHERIQYDDVIFVKIMGTADSKEIRDGQTVLCSIYDISVRGIRLNVPSLIPAGSQVELWVKSKSGEGTLKVEGKVIWCRELFAVKGQQAGIEIKNSKGRDYIRFQQRITNLLLPRISP